MGGASLTRRILTVMLSLAVPGLLIVVSTSCLPSIHSTSKAAPVWMRLQPVTGPGPLDSAASAYDPSSRQLLLFGGESGGGVAEAHTWEWTGARWRLLSPRVHPPPLVGAAMAYDPGMKRLVLFGGFGQDSLAPAQTWTWTGTTWIKQHPALSPSARAGAAMAYDGATGQLLLFGGANARGVALADTWRWTGSTWQEVNSQAPAALDESSMAYDETTGQLVLFGGCDRGCSRFFSNTWVWIHNAWTALGPAHNPVARGSASLAFDPTLNRLVLFGGLGNGKAEPAVHVLNDTWRWSGSTWSPVTGSVAPPARASATMGYDDGSRQLILFGGANGNLDPLSDTWSLSAA